MKHKLKQSKCINYKFQYINTHNLQASTTQVSTNKNNLILLKKQNAEQIITF